MVEHPAAHGATGSPWLPDGAREADVGALLRAVLRQERGPVTDAARDL